MRKPITTVPIIIALLLVLLALSGIPAAAQDTEASNEPVGDPNFPAPDFPTGEQHAYQNVPVCFQ